MTFTIPGIEKRLQSRYYRLVQEHTGHGHTMAAGPRVLPDETPEAAAMAAWRFYKSAQTTFTRLARPLLDAAAQAASSRCDEFALVALDWSKLHYEHHPAKKDRTQIGRKTEIGYKLLSGLLLSDHDGHPLAPLFADLRTAEGLLSSRFESSRKPRSVLDELAEVMGFVRDQPLGKRPVFVIDAEADSVHHLRQWDKGGFLFLTRSDDDRYVRVLSKEEVAAEQSQAGKQPEQHQPGQQPQAGKQLKKGKEMLLPSVARQLRRERAFARVRDVDYKGRKVGQYVAEAAVVLERPAWLNRKVGKKRKRLVVRGKPLRLRLVITELRDDNGRMLERWYLLTNAPKEVSAATIALWYYWRWKIETFFKLLKGHGQQLERWQQKNGHAILKRLLIASMACVLAWRLAHSRAPLAEEARRVVMSLSGRQREHGKDYTLEGLLAGTWVLLAMMALLKDLPPSRLTEIAAFVLEGATGAAPSPPLPLREAG